MVDNQRMSFRNPNILAVVGATEDHRRAGRMRTRNLKVNHGRTQGVVLDLSGTGARLSLYAEPDVQPGTETQVTLTCGDTHVALRASIVWVNPVSRKECQVGIKFSQLNPSEKAAIQHMARVSRDIMRGETRGQ